MKLSVTLAVLGLFLLVAGFYVYLTPYENKSMPAALEKPKAAAVLPLAGDDAVRRIRIERPGDEEPIVLKKDGGRWYLESPIQDSADELLSQGLVMALTMSRQARRLAPEGDWSEYGLAEPELTIGVETEKQEGMRRLFLGDQSPVGDMIYGRWDDEPEYFLLDANIKKAFDKSVYTLRNKRVFRTPMLNVSKIRFRMKGGEYEIAKHDNRWFWMEPIRILGEIVDKESTDRVLTQVQDLYIKDFLDHQQKDESELGFSLLGNAIKVWNEDESFQEVLLLGNDVATRDAFYARRENEASFFFISKSNTVELFQTVASMADRHLKMEKPAESLL